MSEIYNTYPALTTAGQALSAKIEMGSGTIPLEITRIMSASGTSDDPLNLTAGIDEKQEYIIVEKSTVNEKTKISAILINIGVTVGYNLSQILFYAIDPDVGEILYRILQFEKPIPVPAETERSWAHKPKFNIITGNASEVIVNIDSAGVATMEWVEERLQNLPLATETQAGIIRIATAEEVKERTNNNAVLTPGNLPLLYILQATAKQDYRFYVRIMALSNGAQTVRHGRKSAVEAVRTANQHIRYGLMREMRGRSRTFWTA